MVSTNTALALLLLLPFFSLSFAAAPEDNLNQCLCDCGCSAIGWECYSGNEICKYDVPASPDPSGMCPAEATGTCLCRSGYGCNRVAPAAGGACYDNCMASYNQAVEPEPEPAEDACGDGICSDAESAEASCPEDCTSRQELCGNGADDDGDGLADCLDTADCKCSQTVWLTVTYKGEDGRQKPVSGADVNFTWTGKDYSENEASAETDEEGKAYAKLDGLWEEGAVSFGITLSDPEFRVMDGASLYSSGGEFTVESEGDLQQSYEMEGNDRIIARLWERSHEAYDFYKALGTSVDSQMPEELYIKSADQGGAFHAMSSPAGAYPMAKDEGITFRSKIFAKGFGDRASPQNCEWHEFNHHAMNAIYGGMWDTKRINNHLGWGNPQSDDSYIEGFAEFMSLLEAKYYADKYPRLAKYPSVYYWDGTASNLEKNYNIKDDEEFAAASILWDLYDPQSSSIVDKDHIQIDRNTLWGVLSRQHRFSDGQTRYIHSIRDLYEAVKALNESQFYTKHDDYFEPKDDAWMDQADDLDKLFIAHGAFWDKNDNGRWDPGEEAGYTPTKGKPETKRTDKELPSGAFIRANINNGEITDGIAKMKVSHGEGYEYLDYEYESDFENGLIGIGPPYDVPTTWEITVAADGSPDSEALVLTSDEYNRNYDPESSSLGTVDFTIGGAGGSGAADESQGWDDTGTGSGAGATDESQGSGDGGAGGCIGSILFLAFAFGFFVIGNREAGRPL